jgi:hypothetical protein
MSENRLLVQSNLYFDACGLRTVTNQLPRLYDRHANM